MATKAKKTGAKQKPSPTAKTIDSGYATESTCPQYVDLRTMLDSVEIGSVRYYLNGKNPAEKDKRFEAVKPLLMQVVELVWADTKKVGCPPGYSNCDGCCVPYDCYFGG